MVFFAILFFALLFLFVSSTLAGLLIGVLTVPLLYVTGYGFLPLGRMPALGASFRSSVAFHVAVATLVFGPLSACVVLTAFLPETVKGEASMLLLVGGPTLALVWTIVTAPSDTEPLSLRRVVPLIVVWHGYPLVFVVPFLWTGVQQGWATLPGG